MKFIKNSTENNSRSDLELIAAYKKTGGLDVLGQVYNRYMSLVYGVCFNYFKEEEQSKDAVMQIFEELVVKLRIHEVQNFKSWLHV
ncbi:MAG: sigma-70 family RNA polymerase sigma factor, partial [Pedobacter sp.]